MLYQFSEVEILAFIMIVLRVAAFLVSWPIFGATSMPSLLKILAALVISFLLMPTISWQGIEADLMSSTIIWLALKEACIGVFLGYLCRLFFFAVGAAGEIISISMGLSSAQVMNPALGSQSNVVEQFQVVLATLFFLAINGHHVMITALSESFQILPLSLQSFQTEVFSQFGQVVSDVVVAGVKISAPVMISILIVNVAMGIIGRAVPQINVLITSLPVNILVGLIIFLISVPLFIDSMSALANQMFEHLFHIMREV